MLFQFLLIISEKYVFQNYFAAFLGCWCVPTPDDWHTARHLFNCDAVPARLVVEDLWHNPVQVVDFIQ